MIPNPKHRSSQASPLREPPEDDEAEGDEAAHDDAVPPLLGRYPANERVDAGHLARGDVDAAVDARERLALQVEAVVDGVRLAQHAVDDAVAVVDAAALVGHVVGLGGLRVRGAVLVDVGAHVGEQVGAVARLLEVGAEAGEVALVVAQLVAQERDVLRLDGRGGEGLVRVEQARELAYDVLSLIGTS
jgi:hypothetical protein